VPGIFFRKLNKKIFKTEIQGMGIDVGKFFFGKKPVQINIIMMAHGMVLGHETERQPTAEFQKQAGQGIYGIILMAGNNQMPDQHPFFGDLCFCPKHVKKAFLSDHLCDGIKRYLRVVPAFRQSGGKVRVRIFEIRKINVCVILCMLQRFHCLVTGCVESHGKIKTLLPQEGD